MAHLVAQERGTAIGARDVVAMATINGARILKWDRHLGSVEPGRLADLMVVNGRGGDPYEHPPPAPPDVSSPQLT